MNRPSSLQERKQGSKAKRAALRPELPGMPFLLTGEPPLGLLLLLTGEPPSGKGFPVGGSPNPPPEMHANKLQNSTLKPNTP